MRSTDMLRSLTKMVDRPKEVCHGDPSKRYPLNLDEARRIILALQGNDTQAWNPRKTCPNIKLANKLRDFYGVKGPV